MTVPFNFIPANLRLPLFFAELDNSQANTGQVTSRAVLIGQMTSAGIAAANIPMISAGPSDAITQFGEGSILANMVTAYRAADPFGELWCLPLADNGAGTAAAGSINFTAAPTGNGTLNLYIGGVNVQTGITSVMTPANVATAVAAAINATPNLFVSAAVDGMTASKVDITFLHKGLSGNDIDIRVNYRGSAGGEATPAGLTFTIVAMSGGASNPVLTTALANLDSQAYDFIIQPYNDSTSTTAMTTYLNDSAGTWSWAQQMYGGAWGAFRGNFAAQVTFGNSLNDQHTQILGLYDSPTPSFIIAADFAATAAPALRADPARPIHTLTMTTMLPPPLASRFPATERNTLLFDGISTFTVTDSGLCQLEGTITTYQQNAFGQPDDSYLQINTLYNLASILQQLKLAVTSKYARVKLAADGTKFADGSAIVTPSSIKAELIAQYQNMEYNGQVQNSAAFIAGLIVEQNATYPYRVDVLFDPSLIDQLDVFALLAQFRLR